jgi:uncharacterized repeat protein (TIGR03803 family)
MACGGKTGRYFSFRKHYSRRSSRRMESKLVSKHLLPWFWLACFTLGGTGHAAAADHIFQIETNAAVLYCWPYDTNYTDLGFIGIPENVVSNGLAPGSSSMPNVYGTYSYIDLNSSSLVSNANTYTFLIGSLTLDDAGFVNPNLPLFKAAHFYGTEPYPGHGPMNLQLLQSYRQMLMPPTNALGSNAFYFGARVDFQSTLVEGAAVATNAYAGGFAILLHSNQFSTNLPSIPYNTNDPNADPTPTLMADYVNQVVLPLARQSNPISFICVGFRLTTTGSIPAGPASFPALDTTSTLVAFEFAPPGSNTPPFITTQPYGWETQPGKTASFTVAASGTAPFSYQWQKNETNLANGGNISGATSNTLVISNLSMSDAGVYSVIVSNSVAATPSAPAILVVIGPPTLYAFLNGYDGANPYGALVRGMDGNFYGTTRAGGVYGYGSVFRITPAGALTTLYPFTGFDDGLNPVGALASDASGNLYGTTSGGGANGVGSVFEIASTGQFTTLASFDTTNGSDPEAGLILASDGNYYGTTSSGGANSLGTIFQMTPAGVLTTRYAFAGGNDGANPMAPLFQSANGSFYGTTFSAGSNSVGAVYQLSTNGQFTNLAAFDSLHGANPQAGLIQGTNGNFYGTTTAGGTNGFGTVFQMTPGGALSNLYSFGAQQDGLGNPLDGSTPMAPLILATDGNFYGTAAFGGPYPDIVDDSGDIGYGTVFRISPGGVFTNVMLFHGANGTSPQAPVLVGIDGWLYGTTFAGGPTNAGTVFRLNVGLPAPPVFQMVTGSAGQIVLTWSSVVGKTYQLQYSTNLAQSNWNNLGATVTATNTTITTSDSTSPDTKRFYRVFQLP